MPLVGVKSKTVNRPVLIVVLGLWAFSFQSPLTAYDKKQALDRYFELLQNNPHLAKTEATTPIAVISEPLEIKKNIQNFAQKLKQKNTPSDVIGERTRIGVLAEDPFWLMLRDLVRFPGGGIGTYNRVVEKASLRGFSGSVIVPIDEHKKVGFVVQYRHATQSWEVELPRGLSEPGESPEQTASRELKEETGREASQVHLLGDAAVATSFASSVAKAFVAKIDPAKSVGKTKLDDEEAIAQTIWLDAKQIKEALKSGGVFLKIKKQKQKAYFRDSTSMHALLLAQVHGYLPGW